MFGLFAKKQEEGPSPLFNDRSRGIGNGSAATLKARRVVAVIAEPVTNNRASVIVSTPTATMGRFAPNLLPEKHNTLPADTKMYYDEMLLQRALPNLLHSQFKPVTPTQHPTFVATSASQTGLVNSAGAPIASDRFQNAKERRRLIDEYLRKLRSTGMP